jgi:hypothetical protein
MPPLTLSHVTEAGREEIVAWLNAKVKGWREIGVEAARRNDKAVEIRCFGYASTLADAAQELRSATLGPEPEQTP